MDLKTKRTSPQPRGTPFLFSGNRCGRCACAARPAVELEVDNVEARGHVMETVWAEAVAVEEFLSALGQLDNQRVEA